MKAGLPGFEEQRRLKKFKREKIRWEVAPTILCGNPDSLNYHQAQELWGSGKAAEHLFGNWPAPEHVVLCLYGPGLLCYIPTFPFILRDACIKVITECGFCLLKLLCCFVLNNVYSVIRWYQLGTCPVSCITLRIVKRFWKYNLQVR